MPKLGKTFTVKFQVKPKKFRTDKKMTSILHLTSTDKKGGFNNKGDCLPCLMFLGSTSTEKKTLFICTAVPQGCFSYPNVPRSKWTDIEITQRSVGSSGKYKFEIKINGKVIGSSDESRPGAPQFAREFTNVKVYASNPWMDNAEGQIQKLSIDPTEARSEKPKGPPAGTFPYSPSILRPAIHP